MNSTIRLLLLIVLALAITLPQTSRAEDEPQFIVDLKAGRITEMQALEAMRARAATVTKTCRVMEVKALEDDLYTLRIFVKELGAKATVGVQRVIDVEERIEYNCGTFWTISYITGDLRACDLESARQRLENLRALAENYRRQYEEARGVGEFGTVSEGLAKDKADSTKQVYERMLGEYRKAQEECAKKAKQTKVGDAGDAIPQSPQAVETHNVCYQLEGPLPRDCDRYSQLIGRWTSSKGGVIETTLEADGTISGRILVANPIMERNGFTAGMEVLRGWKPKLSTLTWLMEANNGEYFIAQQPDRKAGEPYGSPTWTRSGVIFIETKAPDRLQLPATLENRLSSYEPWTRTGAPAEETVAGGSGLTL